jgi:hypothetical protein
MILLHILTASLVCLGAFVAIDSLVFTFSNERWGRENLHEWLYSKFLPFKYILKPVMGCFVCSPTFWAWAYCLTIGLPLNESVFVWIGASGVNYVINSWIDV